MLAIADNEYSHIDPDTTKNHYLAVTRFPLAACERTKYFWVCTCSVFMSVIIFMWFSALANNLNSKVTSILVCTTRATENVHLHSNIICSGVKKRLNAIAQENKWCCKTFLEVKLSPLLFRKLRRATLAIKHYDARKIQSFEIKSLNSQPLSFRKEPQ